MSGWEIKRKVPVGQILIVGIAGNEIYAGYDKDEAAEIFFETLCGESFDDGDMVGFSESIMPDGSVALIGEIGSDDPDNIEDVCICYGMTYDEMLARGPSNPDETGGTRAMQ